MANWKHTLKLGDVFHAEDMTFPERRDAIVARIRAAGWFKRAAADEDFDFGYEITNIVDDLADADDPSAFDAAWEAFYDWADEQRVWVETSTALRR